MSKDTHLFQIPNNRKGDASLIHKKSQIEMVFWAETADYPK